jgi:hypothetical protein
MRNVLVEVRPLYVPLRLQSENSRYIEIQLSAAGP